MGEAHLCGYGHGPLVLMEAILWFPSHGLIVLRLIVLRLSGGGVALLLLCDDGDEYMCA